MPLFVRKIALSKWKQNQALDGGHPSADAITGCLRTQDNTLSPWRIAGPEELEDAVLAIASQLQRLDAIDVVTIAPAALQQRGLKVAATPASTPYRSFGDRHHDIIELHYESLGRVAKVVVSAINAAMSAEQPIGQSRQALKAIIMRGLEQGKIRADHLQESLRVDLGLPVTTPSP